MRMARRGAWLTGALALLAAAALAAAEKPHAPASIPGAVVVSAEQVVELILSKPDLVVVDSRKRSEYAKGHIEGAINILNTDMRPEDLARVVGDTARPIVFYCNGTRCLRSTDAVTKALSWGYGDIYWFRGGWKEWSEKRLPVVTE